MNGKLLIRGIANPDLAREFAAVGAEWLAISLQTEADRQRITAEGLISDLQEHADVVGEFDASSSVEEIDRVSLELDLDFACVDAGERERELAKLSVRWIAEGSNHDQGKTAWARIVACPSDSSDWPALAEAARAQRTLLALDHDRDDLGAALAAIRPFGLVFDAAVTPEGFAQIAARLAEV